MHQEEYIDSLRTELVEMVARRLTPVALRYGYSRVPLESNIKWRPMVLVLGNYSSGKSTLINEFLGADVQGTGQAPTDDSFTVITFDAAAGESSVRVLEERDGNFLLNDPEYPFASLRKHGQRFISHFRLKKVNSPFLRNLAIVDTPGMLDSITERDRGYNYQEVIGDLAQIADLVLVLFDPHKAGTVREAHISIRDTLPARTFEDRVLFVLNRIDECASLIDLLQVYGTLCWNLSQITGRKDIPNIHLTYSPHATADKPKTPDQDTGFLRYLENQREELKKAILEAPRYRLDHLATFVETHGERLSHLLEALIAYRKNLLRFRTRFTFAGLLISLMVATASAFWLSASELLPGADRQLLFIGAGLAVLYFLFWEAVLRRYLRPRFHKRQLDQIDRLTPLENQTRQDSWQAVRDLAHAYLKKTGGHIPIRDLRHEYGKVHQVYERGSREIREAINELSAIARGEPNSLEKAIYYRSFLQKNGEDPESPPETNFRG